MQPSVIPQELMRCSLLHFEQGVPIEDLNLATGKRGAVWRGRLARVEHVYWLWMKNPFLDTFAMFKQMAKGKYADVQSEWHAAKKDELLLKFVQESVAPPTRKQDERKVRVAAEQAIRIGMETDNPAALVKGGKLLAEVAHLDQPEDQRADMSKVAFLPSVVVTDIREVDDTKENIDDEETKRIMQKYGGYVDDKRKMVEEKVALMEAKRVEG